MLMEDEKDPWAGVGMDEAGEMLSGTSTNVEREAEAAGDSEEEPNEQREERDEVEKNARKWLGKSIHRPRDESWRN